MTPMSELCRISTKTRDGDGDGSVQSTRTAPRPTIGRRQGLRRLWQGRHRQEHHLVEPVGGLLQAGQARAADRLRSQARLHLHPDQEAAAHGHRRAGVGGLPRRGAAHRGLRLRGLQRRHVRRGRRTARGHRLRRLRGRPDRQAAQGAPPARRHRRGDLRRAGRRGVRRLRGPAAARAAGPHRHRQRLRLDLRDEPHHRRHPGQVEELRRAPGRRHRQPQRGHRPDRPLQRGDRPGARWPISPISTSSAAAG